jgi:hypothetical protein
LVEKGLEGWREAEGGDLLGENGTQESCFSCSINKVKKTQERIPEKVISFLWK